MDSFDRPSPRFLIVSLFFTGALCGMARAQTPPPAADAPKRVAASLDALAWLEGCWRGSVNQRDFREHWLPMQGGMMIGASQTVMQGKTQDFEYLRLETRPDGVYYIAIPSGKKESAFRLVGAEEDDRGTHFTFAGTVDEFPQQIVYHRGAEGWLYASIEGKLNGEDRRVTYPMRRVDCETGEPIRK